MANTQIPVHPGLAPCLGTYQGISIREDMLYTNHEGEEDKGIRERAEKALAKLQEPLRRVIQRDETILYIADCQAPVSAMVLTNRRLLHVLLQGNGNWRKALRSVSWGDLEVANVKGWWGRTLRLRYRNGKREKFRQLRRHDGRKIAMLIPAIQAGCGLANTEAQGMVSLCPACLAPLTPRNYRCDRCGMGFKDEATLVRRALLIPGGGYFYVGHMLRGLANSIAETVLLAAFILCLAGGLAGATAMYGTAVYLGVFLAIGKCLAIHHGRRCVRDFIPAGGADIVR